MIKLKAKMIDEDTIKLEKYTIKHSNTIEHLALICFLIDQICEQGDMSREETIELIQDLMKEDE